MEGGDLSRSRREWVALVDGNLPAHGVSPLSNPNIILNHETKTEIPSVSLSHAIQIYDSSLEK